MVSRAVWQRHRPGLRRGVYENKSIARGSTTPTHVESSIHRLPRSPWQHDIYLADAHASRRHANWPADCRATLPCWGVTNDDCVADRRESEPAVLDGRALPVDGPWSSLPKMYMPGRTADGIKTSAGRLFINPWIRYDTEIALKKNWQDLPV